MDVDRINSVSSDPFFSDEGTPNSPPFCSSCSTSNKDPLVPPGPAPQRFRRWNIKTGRAERIPTSFFQTEAWRSLCDRQARVEQAQMASLRRSAYAESGYGRIIGRYPARNQYCIASRHPYLRQMANIVTKGALGPHADKSDTYALVRGITTHPIVNPDSDAVGAALHPRLLRMKERSGRGNILEAHVNEEIILHRLNPCCATARNLDIPPFKNSHVLIISDHVFLFSAPSLVRHLKKEPFSARCVTTLNGMPGGAEEKPDFIIVPRMTPSHVEDLLKFGDDAINLLADDGRLILMMQNYIHVRDAATILSEKFKCNIELLQPHTSWREISPRMRYLVVAKPRIDASLKSLVTTAQAASS